MLVVVLLEISVARSDYQRLNNNNIRNNKWSSANAGLQKVTPGRKSQPTLQFLCVPA